MALQWEALIKYVRLSPGVHGGADHPPGQRGAGPQGWCCPARGGEPERGGGFRSPGADEPPELPMGAPEGGEHGETEQVDLSALNICVLG